MSNQPIGIFDSGVGGLTIWKAVQDKLPNESIIYLADQRNCPYGNREKNEIINLPKQSVSFLISKECKLIIIACNTATALAIKHLRETFPDVPFVGLEPSVKPAALNTHKKVIGVLATANTLVGKHYLETSARYGKKIKINAVAAHGLVELIESESNELILEKLLVKYLEILDYRNIDYLVLGCTHYPLVIEKLQQLCGDSIKIIDSADAVANQVSKILRYQFMINLSSNNSKYHFYTTGILEPFKKFVLNRFIKESETVNFHELLV